MFSFLKYDSIYVLIAFSNLYINKYIYAGIYSYI